MKAKQRTLLILLALAALAGGALALLTRSNAKAEEAASAAAEGTIAVSSFAVENLTRIQYTYNGQTITLDYADGEWTLADDPEYHLESSRCDTMAAALCALNAKRQLEEESGEDYGFAQPLLTVTVTAAGETHTLFFGDTNSITGDIYLRRDGEAPVYTVASSKAACFEYGKQELFQSFNPAGLTSSALEEIEYTISADGTEETVHLRAYSEPAEADEEAAADSAVEYVTVWRLAEDGSIGLDQNRVADFLAALSSYVSGQVTGADPSQYGMDTPLVTVRAVTAEGEAILHYASGTDGYYLMVEGDGSVYSVDETTIQALLCTQEELTAAE